MLASPRRAPSSNPVRSRTIQDRKSSRSTSRAGSCRTPCSATPSPGTIRCCSCTATAVTRTHGCSCRSRSPPTASPTPSTCRGTGRRRRMSGTGPSRPSHKPSLGLLDTVGINRVHLVGHSMGGAVDHPVAADPAAAGKVASLTLISPVGFGPEINAGYLRGFAEAESRRDLKPHLLAAVRRSGTGQPAAHRRSAQVQAPRRRGSGTPIARREPCRGRQVRRRRDGANWPRSADPPLRSGAAKTRSCLPRTQPVSAMRPRCTSSTALGHMAHMEKPQAVVAAIREALGA